MKNSQGKKGFTILELIIVIAVIAILSVLIFLNMSKMKQKSKLARVSDELSSIATSLSQYAEDNNFTYPPDATRAVPPGLEKYLTGGTWPTSVWPNGVFDWDNWIHPGPGANQGKQIYQMSYRLCDVNDPIESCSDPTLFPHFTRYSSIFYCISGPCVPHVDYINDPAYCVNCKPKEQNPPL